MSFVHILISSPEIPLYTLSILLLCSVLYSEMKLLPTHWRTASLVISQLVGIVILFPYILAPLLNCMSSSLDPIQSGPEGKENRMRRRGRGREREEREQESQGKGGGRSRYHYPEVQDLNPSNTFIICSLPLPLNLSLCILPLFNSKFEFRTPRNVTNPIAYNEGTRSYYWVLIHFLLQLYPRAM